MVLDDVEKEHHAILFLYKADRQRYGKLIMENDVLQNKDPFPKSVADACRILAGWRNCYGNRNNRFTEAYDGVAFTIMDAANSKKVKKKVVTYLKCKKVGHYTK